MGTIKAVCISEKRGTKKRPIPTAQVIEEFGIAGDAHGGNWHRQISLLSYEKIEAFRKKGARISFGDFGENIVAEGFDFKSLPVGTRLGCGEVILEITQVGKECHSHCEIYQSMGDCIMPREGVFARVIKGGTIEAGSQLTLLGTDAGRPCSAAVITLSDRGYQGEREDKSGPIVVKSLTEAGYNVLESLLLPDDEARLKQELLRLTDQRQVNLILTTGGTGFSQRDITPEAVMAVAHRNAPGIAEAIRSYSMGITKRAMLSRGVSVIRGRTLIVTLPGSPKAAAECLEFVLDELHHGIGILNQTEMDCGESR